MKSSGVKLVEVLTRYGFTAVIAHSFLIFLGSICNAYLLPLDRIWLSVWLSALSWVSALLDNPGRTCSIWLASHGGGRNRKYQRVSGQAFVGFRKASTYYTSLSITCG